MDSQRADREGQERDPLLREAADFGIDLDALRANLRLTPAERLRRACEQSNRLMEFQAKVRDARSRKAL